MRRREGLRPGSQAGRMIAWTAVCAVLCWAATVHMVRAVAQEAPPADAPPAASQPPSAQDAAQDAGQDAEAADTNEDGPADPARGPSATASEELPEYRDSADNNISLPVDI
jgi:hypothetical protein